MFRVIGQKRRPILLMTLGAATSGNVGPYWIFFDNLFEDVGKTMRTFSDTFCNLSFLTHSLSSMILINTIVS